MRQGGSNPKGGKWERDVGQAISAWLTHGQRRDLFSRNVLSGGRFTRAESKGGLAGIPGDLMAAHPLAFTFLSSYMVECKHHQDINLFQFMVDTKKTSPLARIIYTAQTQASRNDLDFFLVAKQNHMPPLLLTSAVTGEALMRSALTRNGCTHILHDRNYFMAPFTYVMDHCDADAFLDREPHPVARALPRTTNITRKQLNPGG